MERISCTDDEDDLLELYAAVIQAVFNDRVENEEIERLDVADIIDTFGAIVEIIDISVNEKIRYLGTLLAECRKKTRVARSMNTIRKMDISKRRRRKKYGDHTGTTWTLSYRYV